MIIQLFLLVVALAFILEFFDASAGMGYGTLTPILLLLGFATLEVIPAVILTSAVLSLFAGYLHHDFENVDFSTKKNLKTLAILISFGIIAIIFAAFVAVNIPETWLKVYIGLLVIAIGLSILLRKKKRKFSWKKLIGFGSLASFNKGISGGGYGPVLAGGQIISGVKSKQAVSITALSEGVISFIGFLTYLFIGSTAGIINLQLIGALLIGGIISTPLAVYLVKKFPSKKLKYFVGIISILLGIMILIKVI